MRFRLVTYNIHKGIGGIDRRYRLDRVVEIVTHFAPDVVHLQEVDDGVPRSRFHRQVELLGDALQMDYRAFQANVHLKQGRYGNAILSRFPLADVCHVDLTVPFKKRRRALVAHCRIRQGDHARRILLVNVHLGLAGFERQIQLRRVLEHELLQRSHRETPVIVAGDYNDVWGSLCKKSMEPAGFRATCRAVRTFPAFMPMRPLDRIFYRGAIEAHHCFASHSELSRHASDHLPLVADFELLGLTDPDADA